MNEQEEDCCEDCGRSECWGGSVCNEIKKEREKE